MAERLKGKRVAIVATDGFEESELTEPMKALMDEGATVEVVSVKKGKIQGMKHDKKGAKMKVDRVLADASADDYSALLLPGGVANPDALRMDDNAVAFVRRMFEAGKPVAAICHGPWTLIEAGAVQGRTVTSWPSLRTDLKNAGAEWVDQEVVVDHGLLTGRGPDDLPAFCSKMVEEFQEGRHDR